MKLSALVLYIFWKGNLELEMGEYTYKIFSLTEM